MMKRAFTGYTVRNGQVLGVAKAVADRSAIGWWGVSTATVVHNITSRILELLKTHEKTRCGEPSTFREGGISFIFHTPNEAGLVHVDVFVDYSNIGLSTHRIPATPHRLHIVKTK